jgi:hypothetical protein
MISLCIATLIVNNTEVFSRKDEKILASAKARCQQLYPDAPCLIKFIKKDDTTYNVICGETRRRIKV